MNLSESEVQEQLDNLVKRHYLRTVSGFGNRVTKYEQRFVIQNWRSETERSGSGVNHHVVIAWCPDAR